MKPTHPKHPKSNRRLNTCRECKQTLYAIDVGLYTRGRKTNIITVCPNCGKPVKNQKKTNALIAALLWLILFGIVLGGLTR